MIFPSKLDNSTIEGIADRVVEVLEKREADKKENEVRIKVEAAEEARKTRIAVVQMQLDAEHARQAECKHDDKIIHKFTSGLDKWTRCRDCGKTWKEQVEYPSYSKFRKCTHANSLREIEVPNTKSFIQCGTCCQTWK